MGRRFGSHLLLQTAAVASLGLVLAQPSRADTPTIYKWVDANGIAHYTTDPDQIPDSLRNRIRKAGEAPLDSTASDWLMQDAVRPSEPSYGLPSVSAPPPVTESIDVDAPFREGTGTAVAARPLPAVSADLRSLEARIVELETAIAQDQEALKVMISEPSQGDGSALADLPEFRVIAERLPGMQHDLEDLRSQRARLENP